MTSAPTPTPAQRVALEAIRDGKVQRYYPDRRNPRAAAPSWVSLVPLRSDVITRCVDARWALVGSAPGGMYALLGLTDAGREALACRS